MRSVLTARQIVSPGAGEQKTMRPLDLVAGKMGDGVEHFREWVLRRFGGSPIIDTPAFAVVVDEVLQDAGAFLRMPMHHDISLNRGDDGSVQILIDVLVPTHDLDLLIEGEEIVTEALRRRHGVEMSHQLLVRFQPLPPEVLAPTY